MVMKAKSFVLILSLSVGYSARSVISNELIPFLSEPFYNFNKLLTQNPIARGISDLTGDVIAVSGQALTHVPLEITRLIGIKGKLPTILDNNIDGKFQETFLEQFNAGKHNEDAYLHITELVTKYGYPIDEHTVPTSDGYILTLFRIQKEEGNVDKPIVLLMHGLLGSSDDWVLAGPDNGLAYILADLDYDVWLGNARGNTHSRRHTTLSPSSSRFWDFSWHEIGTYDLPAMIDHILITTGKKSLKYVGHSQGTTAFFVMCSEIPEYNERIELMVALSPVAWMTNVISPVIRLIAPASDLIHSLLSTVGINEFLPNHTILKTLGQILCAENSLSQIVCSNVLFLTCGFSLEQMNSTTLPVILGHLPAGASAKQFVHYAQGIVSTDFRKFNFGMLENYEKYGSETPPRYRVDRITAPVSLVYSDEDWLASPEDVAELSGQIGNVVDMHRVSRARFNHLDFLWGLDAKELIFKRMLKIMETY